MKDYEWTAQKRPDGSWGVVGGYDYGEGGMFSKASVWLCSGLLKSDALVFAAAHELLDAAQMATSCMGAPVLENWKAIRATSEALRTAISKATKDPTA